MIRPLTRHDEFAAAVRLQKAIWGFEDVDVLPVRLFVTADKVGGQILGAFDGPELIGFSLAIPGIKPGGKTFLHSHMVGVLDRYRNTGVGRTLKLEQRTGALARGFDLIEWTFDPLEVKNAYFNLERLGAVVRRFVPNQYGNTTSPLHAGLPTDRCVAEWWIRSPRAEAILNGNSPPRRITGRIEVPAAIDAIKRSDAARAREIQTRISGEFLEAVRNNLAATGFERAADTSAYILEPWECE